MATDVSPFALIAANGCVPDLSGQTIMAWPGVAGEAKGQETKAIRFERGSNNPPLPEVAIFDHMDFNGMSQRTSLNWSFVGDWWNDRISSIIVFGGQWRFYEHRDYRGRYLELQPGHYPRMLDIGVLSDVISSFHLVDEARIDPALPSVDR
jgi:hypothetical protein